MDPSDVRRWCDTAYGFAKSASELMPKSGDVPSLKKRPILFLTAHAYELLLKWNLLENGATANDVRKYSHRIRDIARDPRSKNLELLAHRLARKCVNEGLADERDLDLSEVALRKRYCLNFLRLNRLVIGPDYIARYPKDLDDRGPHQRLLLSVCMKMSELAVRQPSRVSSGEILASFQ